MSDAPETKGLDGQPAITKDDAFTGATAVPKPNEIDLDLLEAGATRRTAAVIAATNQLKLTRNS